LFHRARGLSAMMIRDRFDRRTIAAMEVALDRACQRWPNGGDHMLRKRVAQNIIRCAEAGNRSLDALFAAGERALAPSPDSETKTNLQLKSQSVV
jgi:hypothetical protein